MTPRKTQLIIFDLDDTLIDTSDVYWRARSRFVDTMLRQGYDPAETVELFEEIDGVHMRQLGFSPHRYRLTMFATYKRILERRGEVSSNAIVEEIADAGQMIFDMTPNLIDGALQLLNWCFSRFALALVTRGDDSLQRRKIAALGIGHFFSFIDVVELKTAESFLQMERQCGYSPRDTWIVGDSFRADIIPALEIGSKCILYKYKHHAYHWRQEHVPAVAGDYQTAETLGQIVEILKAPRPPKT